MIQKIIESINSTVKEHVFFELSFHHYQDNILTMVGSDDFSYYHQIEISFTNVFSILCNSNFRINTNESFISIIEGNQESWDLNTKYGIIQGNKIFKIISEDGQIFYIAAENISFIKGVVKYF